MELAEVLAGESKGLRAVLDEHKMEVSMFRYFVDSPDKLIRAVCPDGR